MTVRHSHESKQKSCHRDGLDLEHIFYKSVFQDTNSELFSADVSRDCDTTQPENDTFVTHMLVIDRTTPYVFRIRNTIETIAWDRSSGL